MIGEGKRTFKKTKAYERLKKVTELAGNINILLYNWQEEILEKILGSIL